MRKRLLVKASCYFVRLKRNGAKKKKEMGLCKENSQQQSDGSSQADWISKLQHPQSIAHSSLGYP